MAAKHDRLGAAVVRKLFGTQIQEQGRGFYVALELLAICRGVLQRDEQEFLAPEVAAVTYRRSSHDFARRIATGTPMEASVVQKAIEGHQTQDTLRALLASLVVEIPGRRKVPTWYAIHFYPFVGELIHYDAAERARRPAIERYVYRDGGGWAYHVLRTDPDVERLSTTRESLKQLVADSQSALGRVASALQAHDYATPKDFNDESEADTCAYEDLSPWPGHLRRGVNNILLRNDLARAKRVECLMHWVPWCLARHELALARRILGEGREVIPVDLTREPGNQIRVLSQQKLDEFGWNIAEALVEQASRMRDVDPGGEDRWDRYLEHNAKYTKSPRAFFAATLGAIGGLNAPTGRRHFTLKAPLLEALVCASLPPQSEMELHQFAELLNREYALVVTDRTATSIGLTDEIDAGVFRGNAAAFKDRLRALGLLTHYSDATSLVHGESR